MPLFVNTNVSSLNAQRQLMSSGLGLDQAFLRLSSGMRINSAADDAAGLQITDRLQSQILGLQQGNRNANDGISLAQTAEGAMNEVTTMFQRVRTLASQAANGSNTDEDRIAIQEEIRALMSEVNRIASDTTFGGQNLLDGTYSASFQVGADAAQSIGFSMKKVGESANGNVSLSANGGFTLSGIASIASAVNGKSLSADIITDKAFSTLQSVDSNFDRADAKFSSVFVASSISVSSQNNAQLVLAGMDALIAVVDKKRAELGAVQNRFQSTINNQANIAENLAAAHAAGFPKQYSYLHSSY
jgi:flagellin